MENVELKAIADQFGKVVETVETLKKEIGHGIMEAKQGSDAALKAIESKDAQIKALGEKFDKDLNAAIANMARPGNAAQDEAKSLGQRFVLAAKSFIESGTLLGQSFDVKNISNLAASAGALNRADRDPTVYRTVGGYRQMRIADLIPALPTNSNAVEAMRLTNAGAAAAPQGTVAGIGGGELVGKTQVDMAWSLVTVPIRTMAAWVPVSRQALNDGAYLSAAIDIELVYKLQLLSDVQLLSGDGTGQNILGIRIDTATNDAGGLAALPADTLSARMIDHIRTAITICQQSEYYNINGVVLNPADWQTLETAKATNGHYLRVAFAATAGDVEQMWRIPVVVSNAMPAGQFLLGDWTLGAQRYVREGVTVRTSEHHASLFVQNAIAVLAEERYGLGISRPKAFTRGRFVP